MTKNSMLETLQRRASIFVLLCFIALFIVAIAIAIFVLNKNDFIVFIPSVCFLLFYKKWYRKRKREEMNIWMKKIMEQTREKENIKKDILKDALILSAEEDNAIFLGKTIHKDQYKQIEKAIIKIDKELKDLYNQETFLGKILEEESW